jgi:tetratricopeptide (TPR) repeat protein
MVALAVFAIVLGACASGNSSRAPARIEIQEAVGFTITEDSNVSGDMRTSYEEGVRLLEQGQQQQGIQVLQDVTQQAPDLVTPHIDLGIALHRAGDLEGAEEALLQARELNPEHPVVHNELGIIYRKTGRFAEARDSYEAALAIYPNYHYTRRNLAVLCDLYLADFSCALENYEAYMNTVPGDDEATMWVADLRNRMGQEG